MVEFYRKIKNNVRGTILHMNIILLDHTEYADKFKDICHKFKTIVDVEVFETDSKFIDAKTGNGQNRKSQCSVYKHEHWRS